MNELDPVYKGSRQVINQRQKALPGQFQSELSGLEAQQQEAFSGIMNAARSRGLGFSGIPVGEQAQYNASQFMPAVARLKGQQHETSLSLQDALNTLGREQRTQAQSIFDTMKQRELQRQQLEEQRRQFQEELSFKREQLRQQRELAEMQAAAARGGGGSAGAGAYLGSGGGGGGSAGARRGPTISQRSDGGFNFTDASGRPISAYTYAQQTGTPIGSLLARMAESGDRGARTILQSGGLQQFLPGSRVQLPPSLRGLRDALFWQ